MWAVLSDIHGNLEALDAVLADIAKHPVSQIICLGDVVGYGPNPVECLLQAQKWGVTLCGNCDHAVMLDLAECAFSQSLEASLRWSQDQLQSGGNNSPLAFIAARPLRYEFSDFLFVHGSPRNPHNEYIFPEDVYNEPKMIKIGALFERYCLCGHTHVPGVFTEPRPGESQWEYIHPADCFGFHRLDGRKAIVNVGSVGQPRDQDWRACYALVDGWDVIWRRVEYDVDATVAKIYAIPELDDFLGDRLREGR